MYGDSSDGIKSVVHDKNIIILKDADEELKKQIQYMGENPQPLNYYKTRFFQGMDMFTTFHKLLNLSCTPQSFQKFFKMADANFQVIESLLPLDSDIDIKQFEAELDLKLSTPKFRSLGKSI